MAGEPETYTVVNYVTEMRVTGKPWVTWPTPRLPRAGRHVPGAGPGPRLRPA